MSFPENHLMIVSNCIKNIVIAFSCQTPNKKLLNFDCLKVVKVNIFLLPAIWIIWGGPLVIFCSLDKLVINYLKRMNFIFQAAKENFVNLI